MSDGETPTQALHRLTSYHPGGQWDAPIDDPLAVQDFVSNDMGRLPWYYKRYAEPLPRIALPRDLPSTGAPAVAVLAGTADAVRTPLDLPHLSRILHLSGGVVRTAKRTYGTHLFRASGSAGGRFPLELYAVLPEGTDAPGVHWYDPLEHALVQVGPPPRDGVPAVVVTGVPWRTGWRYRERGYRHVYWDAGSMLAQLLALADSAGHDARLYTRFPDATVAALVGAEAPHEFPVAVVAFGGIPALDATGEAKTGEVDAAPVEFPLATAAQAAGDQDTLGTPWERGDPVDVAVGTPTTDAVILAKGSQRLMDPNRGLPADVLDAAMRVAMRGIDLPHFVAVHDVAGREPGVYRFPDLTTPVRTGAMRDELYEIALRQNLAGDAAFVVIAATEIAKLDSRGYREANLGAGLVSGRVHLVAYGLGAGATGMTFYDSEIPGLVGAPLDGLLFTCVGVPEYRSATGGLPGAPTDIRMVVSRVGDL